MDVDGVLTDGTVHISSDGTETKSFSILDGMGLVRLNKAGVIVAWISGRASGASTARATELKVPHLIQGRIDKLCALQELATAHIEGIAAKAIILNNQHLGMVVQWEDRFHGGNRGHTFLGDPKNLKRIYPDYVELCKGFGVPCERVHHKKDLPAAIKRMLDSKEAYVLDVMTPYTEHVLPMIPSGKTYKDIITE